MAEADFTSTSGGGQGGGPRGRIAGYALGRDYHEVLEAAFGDLARGESAWRPRSDMSVPRADGSATYRLKTMDGVVPRYRTAAVRINSDTVTFPTRHGTRVQEKLPASQGQYFVGLDKEDACQGGRKKDSENQVHAALLALPNVLLSRAGHGTNPKACDAPRRRLEQIVGRYSLSLKHTLNIWIVLRPRCRTYS